MHFIIYWSFRHAVHSMHCQSIVFVSFMCVRTTHSAFNVAIVLNYLPMNATTYNRSFGHMPAPSAHKHESPTTTAHNPVSTQKYRIFGDRRTVLSNRLKRNLIVFRFYCGWSRWSCHYLADQIVDKKRRYLQHARCITTNSTFFRIPNEKTIFLRISFLHMAVPSYGLVSWP